MNCENCKKQTGGLCEKCILELNKLYYDGFISEKNMILLFYHIIK